MKNLIALTGVMLLSLNLYAGNQTLNLTATDSVKVSCPQGNIVELKDNVLKCDCAGNTYAHMEGNLLKCEAYCEIKVVVVEGDTENCDQGGCYNTGHYKYNALQLIKHPSGELLSSEQIYSPRPSEFNMLFNDAKDLAKKSCRVTMYNGKIVE